MFGGWVGRTWLIELQQNYMLQQIQIDFYHFYLFCDKEWTKSSGDSLLFLAKYNATNISKYSDSYLTNYIYAFIIISVFDY